MPDLSLSIHKNALRALGETPPAAYFRKPFNLAFHDLTSGKSLPAATHRIIGLSTKFCPVPKYASPKSKQMLHLRAFKGIYFGRYFSLGMIRCT